VGFWFTKSVNADSEGGVLGPLEWRVLEVLWERDAPASVRDVIPAFPEAAYTTLMTTLERLARKGMLVREKRGRAFEYQPRLSRVEFESERAAYALRHALERGGGSLAPIASCLIEAVGDRDRELLDELEARIAAKRRESRSKRA
jgi:predicted transcriptional regulator